VQRFIYLYGQMLSFDSVVLILLAFTWLQLAAWLHLGLLNINCIVWVSQVLAGFNEVKGWTGVASTWL